LARKQLARDPQPEPVRPSVVGLPRRGPAWRLAIVPRSTRLGRLRPPFFRLRHPLCCRSACAHRHGSCPSTAGVLSSPARGLLATLRQGPTVGRPASGPLLSQVGPAAALGCCAGTARRSPRWCASAWRWGHGATGMGAGVGLNGRPETPTGTSAPGYASGGSRWGCPSRLSPSGSA
jgi:hypothetical protein